MPNPYLDYLCDPSFQRVNRLFTLLFENTTDRTVHTKYYLPTVEIKYFNDMIIMIMIAIDLSKQQALDVDPKAIRQIDFVGKFRKRNKCQYNNVFHY